MVETGQHEPPNEPMDQREEQREGAQVEHLGGNLEMKSEQVQPLQQSPQQEPAECAAATIMCQDPLEMVAGDGGEPSMGHKVGKLKVKGEKRRRRKKKRPAHKSKMITGYIIYASEIRKDVIKKFPNRDFGYISKLVGIEWKNLPTETKLEYEKRAQEQNAQSRAIAATELKKLAEAEEKAREEALLLPPTNPYLPSSSSLNTSTHFRLNHNNNNITSYPANSPQTTTTTNNHLQLQLPYNLGDCYTQSPIKISMQQQPLQLIHHHQQQPLSTTIQYCSNSLANGNSGYVVDNSHLQSNNSFTTDAPSHSSQMHPQRNTIVYRKPATVRLRPKDALTQTESIQWIVGQPKKPLKFSQTFIDYLSRSFNA